MVNAIDIARYMLYLAAGEPEPEGLTPMRLQKLLYYAQGWRLALTGQPLFDSPIEAWTHGPVVRTVYPRFADYGGSPIAFHESSDGAELPDEIRAYVREVWESLRQHSAGQLRRMTHSESPWLDARHELGPDDASNTVISQQAMRDHFVSVYNQAAAPGLEIDAIQEAERERQAGRGIPLSEALKGLRRAV